MKNFFLNIQYSKLIITFFAHLFVSVLYGSFFSLMAKEYGAPQWLCITIQLFTITLVTFVAYKVLKNSSESRVQTHKGRFLPI